MSSFGCRTWGLVFRVRGFRVGVSGLGFWVEGLRFRVWGFGCRVWGVGIRVKGLVFRGLYRGGNQGSTRFPKSPQRTSKKQDP